jgi:hypothetical protein
MIRPYFILGITPPKSNQSEEDLRQIAARQSRQHNEIAPDATVLYDISEESENKKGERPFPFLKTVEPGLYVTNYLKLTHPVILYQRIDRFDSKQFQTWINIQQPQYLVLVGSVTKQSCPTLTLKEGYQHVRNLFPNTQLGGIVIAERHAQKGNEHLRVWGKIEDGCSFFISQCVFDLPQTLQFLDDYLKESTKRTIAIKPIIFTLTPCGSLATLNFMEWLGIHFEHSVRNTLIESEDMLATSINSCLHHAELLVRFCSEHQMPFGFNVESVSNRKAEIQAAHQLFSVLKQKYARVEQLVMSTNS